MVTDDLKEWQIKGLMEDNEKQSSEIRRINDTLATLALNIQKIALTLEKIEKVEDKNLKNEERLIKLEEKINEVQKNQSRLMGGIFVLVFIIELTVKFLPVLIKSVS